MQPPLHDFDFSILDDINFKEDSVREEIIAPLLWGLGYSASGTNRIVRSQRLQHPFVAIGTSQHRISLVPDYLMLVDGKPAWILDAKAPNESVTNPNHLAQAYSYVIHRDVRAQWYAVCNGRELAAFHVGDMSATPRLHIRLPELTERRWSDFAMTLGPTAIRSAEKRFAKDFGIHLMKLGIKPSTLLRFADVPVHMLGRLSEDMFLLHINTRPSEGSEYAVSFDFEIKILAQLLESLPKSLANTISQFLKEPPPSVAVFEGTTSTVNIAARLGDKIEENDQEHYLPLKAESFSKGRDRERFP